jgi:hypothetical protein
MLNQAPMVFPRKNDFVVAWFDAEGLAFTKTSWAATLPDVQRLRAVTPTEAGHTSIQQLADGGFVVAVPLTPGSSEQVSLFRFDLADEGPSVKAIGVTRHSSSPDHAAVASVGDRFLVAWDDEPKKGQPRVVALSSFDANGKEVEAETVLSSPATSALKPVLSGGETSAVAAWTEGEGDASVVMVRAVDAKGAALGPATRVGGGTTPTLSAIKDGYVLSFAKKGDAGAPAQIASVRLDAAGKPAQSGVVISELGKGKGALAGSPATTVTEDGRVAVSFVYADGMRSHLVTLKIEGCL